MLSRETKKQLWQDLVARSTATPDRQRIPLIAWSLTALLVVLALYVFARI